MDKLFTLLTLQRQAREASSRQALTHIIVNETHKLIAYDQAVLWSTESGKVKLERLSGNAVLDARGIYATALQKFLQQQCSAFNAAQPVVICPQGDGHAAGVIVFFHTADDGITGGLWLERQGAYNAAETEILAELGSAYAQALTLHQLRAERSWLARFFKLSKMGKLVLLGLVVGLCWPVHLTITAPAEIVAKDALPVTVPFDGVIEKITINPGDAVTQRQILATLESSGLQAEATLAAQALEAQQAALARLQREAVMQPEKRAELSLLEAQIAERKIQQDYANTMMAKSEIKAARDGIAVYTDKARFEGKPVRTGDVLMMLAKPQDIELLIRVPVDAMVPIDNAARVKFFLNVKPLSGLTATIKSIGYEPSLDVDNMLTYKIRAEVKESADLRIGWKGTARIQGHKTIMAYAILRRPLAALRYLTGI